MHCAKIVQQDCCRLRLMQHNCVVSKGAISWHIRCSFLNLIWASETRLLDFKEFCMVLPPSSLLDMLSLVTLLCAQNAAAAWHSNRANRGVYWPPEGPEASIAGGGMWMGLVASVFPSKLSHVIKYHGGLSATRVFFSANRHMSANLGRGGVEKSCK